MNEDAIVPALVQEVFDDVNITSLVVIIFVTVCRRLREITVVRG